MGSVAARVLEARDLHAGYPGRPVVREVSLRLEPGRLTALVGPNGSGKSTLLRTLARLHRPSAGQVIVDGVAIERLAARRLARRLAFLPQAPLVPAGVTVRELVEHGRYAHTGPLGRAADADREAVAWALQVTDTAALASRPLADLSGGERQRAWIAMVLAQRSGVLLLDEPTTFLDLRYQVEVLTLARRLADEHGIAVGLVLHDLNQAAAYADLVVVLGDGQVVAAGPPDQVVTAATIRRAFGLDVTVVPHPATGRPTCLPYGGSPDPEE